MVEISEDDVSRARHGDAEAFRAILRAFQKPVFQTVFRLVGGRFPSDVEDITQDIFVKIYRSLPKFDPDRGVKFSTWIYTFVKNHCFDVLKKRRVPVVSYDAADGSSDPAGLSLRDGMPPPNEQSLTGELGRQIQDAVGGLPYDQRLVFVLREYQGLDYREIGQVVGCSEGTVKSRLYRAKEALRRALRQYVQQS